MHSRVRVPQSHLEASNGAEVRVEHEHSQSRELSGAVPTISAVHQHGRLVLLYDLGHLHRSPQHNLGGRGRGGEGRGGGGGRGKGEKEDDGTSVMLE